ncbi:VUT family protein [Streptosporangium sp. NPDC020072]|uniref:VUT family protein n=1 Tax=Streptosporangium sp. NPDC020072 TaxID=3154788 RepID=UPI003435AEE2
MILRVLAALGYLATIVAANWATSRYGMIGVGFGLTATAGTFAAGGALLLRDVVQDAFGRAAVLAVVLAGALLSYLLATPVLALASGAAFLLSETADMVVYTPLRERGFVRAVLASNLVGAVADTVVFLALAGFPIWAALPGQLVGKAWMTLVPLAVMLLVRGWRCALPRQPLQRGGTGGDAGRAARADRLPRPEHPRPGSDLGR